MRRLLLSLLLLAGVGTLSAQGLKDVRINEIQVFNSKGYEDDYGNRVGWIELHNTGHAVVDLGGMFLRVNGKVYPIPKHDSRTVLGPLGYVIFFAEGTAAKGTFHTNFTLAETEFIEFSESRDGPPVDRFEYKLGDMVDNVSYGYFTGEDGVERKMNLPETTPMATNNTLETESRADQFRKQDPHGVVMALTAMSVVFTGLIILYLIFRTLGKAFISAGAQKAKPAAAHSPKSKKTEAEEEISPTGDEFAAISMAIYLYSRDLHDVENTVLTINRGAKAYSPWSSKIYGLRQIPDKR
jgi:Na+-transporting methylmalonyl-CoA/oxaloacetate decarboxylase gamma subunit